MLLCLTSLCLWSVFLPLWLELNNKHDHKYQTTTKVGCYGMITLYWQSVLGKLKIRVLLRIIISISIKKYFVKAHTFVLLFLEITNCHHYIDQCKIETIQRKPQSYTRLLVSLQCTLFGPMKITPFVRLSLREKTLVVCPWYVLLS